MRASEPVRSREQGSENSRRSADMVGSICSALVAAAARRVAMLVSAERTDRAVRGASAASVVAERASSRARTAASRRCRNPAPGGSSAPAARSASASWAAARLERTPVASACCTAARASTTAARAACTVRGRLSRASAASSRTREWVARNRRIDSRAFSICAVARWSAARDPATGPVPSSGNSRVAAR